MANFIHRSDPAPPCPSGRRRFLRGLFAAAVGTVSLALAGAATAQPAGGRMDPGERERMRRDLRERGAHGGPPRDGGRGDGRGDRSGDGRADRSGDGRGGGAGEQGRGRMSDDDRQQLRKQIREAGRGRN